MKKLLHKIPEVAEMLSMSKATVRRLVARGDLVAIPKVRHILITRESIDRFVVRSGPQDRQDHQNHRSA